MWDVVGLSLVALLVIHLTYWVTQWRNPKCNGVLPPGSMGLPLIGETLNLLTPSYSLDLHPFLKKRFQRYGPLFRTNLAGKPVVVSADPEFNKYVMQQEGRMVELWYLDSFSKIFGMEGESRATQVGVIHKYLRSLFLNHFGAECIKEKLLPQLEETINKHLCAWSNQESVEVKQASSVMILNFSAEHMIGYDPKTAPENLGERYNKVAQGFLSFPLNVPGTSYHNSLKVWEKLTTMFKDLLRERRNSPEKHRGDLLDQIIIDMNQEKFVSEDLCINLIFGGLYAAFESISTILTLFFSLLEDHPAVLQELTAEHEALLKNRENPNSALTWDEYKSMTFTLQVINEALRLGNSMPGLFRKVLKDIPVKGYTIPAGWVILLVTPALHLSPNTFKDHLEFNPWRWKDLDSLVIAKNFMPFGGGLRQCAGAEYTRMILFTFLHVLVTKYRWTTVKGARISRSPILAFGDGAHIKFSEKKN